MVGSSGSGKTYLARQLAAHLQLPHLELDAVQHLPRWQAALHEFKTKLQAFLSQAEARGGWVIDGNCNDRTPELFDAADTVVWLDYPRWFVVARVIRRTLGRILFRRPLWNSKRDTLRALLSRDPSRNIVLWAWTQHETDRLRYLAAMQETDNLRWVRLRTPRQARVWLRSSRKR